MYMRGYGEMKQFLLAALVAGIFACLPGGPACAATAPQVDQSIEKAKAYLYSKQVGGNWDAGHPPGVPEQTGAWTAMSVYALLSAGESPNDPRIQAGVKYLLKTPTEGVYSLGIRCQVWLALAESHDKEILAALQRDGELLLKAGHPDKLLLEKPSMFYSYAVSIQGGYNHSTSQYGVLGMWACEQAGYEVSQKYWQAVDAGWRAHQHPNGAWSYLWDPAKPQTPEPLPHGSPFNDDTEPRATMTAIGIATLFVSDDYLHGNDGLNCTGNIVDPNIESGLQWMAKHFDSVYERSIATCYYGLYGIEPHRRGQRIQILRHHRLVPERGRFSAQEPDRPGQLGRHPRHLF